jgi:TolB protein
MTQFVNYPKLTQRRLWVVALLVFLIIGAGGSPDAAAQGGEASELTIIAPALNVRSGPGLAHPVVGLLAQGDQVPLIDHDAATNWWQVQLPDGRTGWVSGGTAYVSVNFNPALAQDTPTPASPFAPAGTPLPSPPVPQSSNPPSPSTGTLIFQTTSGGPIYATTPDGANLRYLTTGLDPALSPDGQWVAFARWETSQDGALGNLWLINVDGSSERVIHEYVFNPRTPAWSPDGRQIVMSHQRGGYVRERRVCGDQPPPREAYYIDTTREGRKIVRFCYTLPPDPHWGLRRVDLASGQATDLTGDIYSLSPAWDPNSASHLIYDGEYGLVQLDLNENRTWALTDDVNDHSPVFSPDGSQIALSYRQDDHWEVHAMQANGSHRRRLTQTSYLEWVQQELRGQQPHSYNNAAPAWSPDGLHIAFLTDRTGQWEIWVMQADGSEQRPLLSAAALGDIRLQYRGVDEQVLTWR